MTTAKTPVSDPKDSLLDAILPHVPFDGWTEESFRMAIDDSGMTPDLARALCPRGAVELAIAFHRRGDADMVQRLTETDLSEMRFRDRIAAGVRFRLEAVEDKELVRRGATLFALPQYAGDGAKLVWETCDHIWNTLGDTSEDVNWYTKRMTLSGVYSSTVLYWLGDESFANENTWEFLDRRIDNVMQFEKFKGQFKGNPLFKPLTSVAGMVTRHIRKPDARRDDLPGSLNPTHQK